MTGIEGLRRLALAAALALPAAALADATVSGTVTSGGTAVAGAFVAITGTNGRYGDITDATGAYSIAVVTGSYTVAAQAQGYYWPTTCGGEARCTTCACEVVSGAPLLTEMGRAERRALVTERGEGILETNVRLACQAHLRGEGIVVVRKAGVRRPDETTA